MPSFAEVLASALVEAQVTPAQLASATRMSTASVEAWLQGGQVPQSHSVWKVASVLSGAGDDLFASAAATNLRRVELAFDPSTPLRWDKALSAYMGTGLARLSGQDAAAFTKIWSALLEKPPPVFDQTRFERSAPTESRIVRLPEPSVLLVHDWRRVTEALVARKLTLHDLPWKKFEDLVAHLLESSGWQVQPMGYTKDDGIDLIAVTRVRPDIRFSMMVQCKRLAPHRKIEVNVVREIWSVKQEYRFHQAMLATTSTFTRGAKQKAERWDLALRDHDAVLQWCEEARSDTGERNAC